MPHGLLFREFDETFSSVFGRRIVSRAKMLRAILNGAKSVSEFADETEVSPLVGILFVPMLFSVFQRLGDWCGLRSDLNGD